MGKRKNGEGTWGTTKKNGYTYKYYKYPDGKFIYGHTDSEVREKKKKWEEKKKSDLLEKQKNLYVTPIARMDIPRKKYTVQEYCLFWLENVHKKNIRRSTYDNYESIANNAFKTDDYNLADKQIGSINQKIMCEYFDSLKKKYSLSRIKQVRIFLNMCFDYAKCAGDMKENYMSGIELPTEDDVAVKKKKPVYLQPEDFEKLFQEAERRNARKGTLAHGINGFIVVASLTCGTRISEMLGLKKRNLHLEEQYIEIEQAVSTVKVRDEKTDKKRVRIENCPKTKNSTRPIPISKKTVYFFQQILAFNPNLKDDDYICITRNGNVSCNNNVRSTLNTMLKKCDCSIKKCGSHALRHSYGSFLISEGVPLVYVSKMMGHSSVAITEKIYIHLLKKKSLEYVSVFDRLTEKNEQPAVDKDIQWNRLLTLLYGDAVA